MEITYDPKKNERNIELRGLSFELARQFDFTKALIIEDERRDYSERRFQAFGPIYSRLHVLVFTPTGVGLRVISLRRANRREVKRYEERP